ncbi:MAG: 4-hydroxy-3-methylbut-2-enyl diphosphate reductase [bacterium]
MRVRVAKVGGFCMGVNRALTMVLEIIHSGMKVTTYGPLIHNRQVIEMLEEKGVRAETEYAKIPQGKVIIRAHGAPVSEIEILKSHGFEIIDGTCPKVKSSHEKIQWAAAQNARIIIVGDHNHDEVIGLKGQSEKECIVVSSLEEFQALEMYAGLVVVLAQTTFSTIEYEKIKKDCAERFPHVKIFDTICSATEKRQEEVRDMARSCDAIIVVGGYDSANTCRLVEISRLENIPTFHVETVKDINKDQVNKYSTIGVTGGASTPPWIINKVVSYLQSLSSHSL